MAENQGSSFEDHRRGLNGELDGEYNTSNPVEGKERRMQAGGAGHHGRVAAAPRQSAMVSQVLQPQYMKLANPGPLGLLAFAITTFVVGLYECGAG